MAGSIADAQRELAAAPAANPITELKAGTLLLTNTTPRTWQVSVGTNIIKAIAAEHITPVHNAPCVVGMVTHPTGQTTAWVLAVTQENFVGGATGKVVTVPGGSATITVDVNGSNVTATIVTPYAPTVNDNCLLEQRGGVLYAVGKVGLPATASTVSQPAPTAPPAPPQTGTSEFRAQDSGTWTQGYNWNGYYGQNVYSGSGYVPPSSGHWFYANATTGLADKTINALRMYLGPRQRAGAYNSAATVHFYRHSSASKAGEPTRTHGPHDISIPAGWGGGWITLPASFGDALKGGGGISIAGDPYVGFASGAAAPASGTLSADWSK